MENPLDVLVLESEPQAAATAAAALEAAGHHVHRCHDEGARAFPCRGLDADACPLESGRIDVALTVRARPRSVPGLLEDGITCALQHRIPVVVSGHTALHPFADHATTVVEPHGDVVAAVESTAIGALRAHEELAAEIARSVLVGHGFEEPEVFARARRRQGVVSIHLIVATEVDRKTRDMIGTRVHTALRRFDRHARQIDIAVG